MTRSRIASMSLAIAALLLAQQALAFGTQRTHEELAREALLMLRSNGQLRHYFSDDLGLSQGVDERLAIQIGLVPELDSQLATKPVTKLVNGVPKSYYEGRLNKSQSALEEVDGEWVAFPDAPKDVFYPIPGSCRGQSDFDACYQDLDRVGIAQLIRIGTYAEDNPNPRAKHHFHDPERSHGLFPAGNHGLDNSKPFLLGLDAFVAEATTVARGGSLLRGLGGILLAPLEALPGVDFGNFALEGRSAVDRALNTPRSGSFPSDQHPDNRFSLPDAERYLYLALSSPEKDLREHYLGLHFVAFGHALHLLQDMASERSPFFCVPRMGHGRSTPTEKRRHAPARGRESGPWAVPCSREARSCRPGSSVG